MHQFADAPDPASGPITAFMRPELVEKFNSPAFRNRNSSAQVIPVLQEILMRLDDLAVQLQEIHKSILPGPIAAGRFAPREKAMSTPMSVGAVLTGSVAWVDAANDDEGVVTTTYVSSNQAVATIVGTDSSLWTATGVTEGAATFTATSPNGKACTLDVTVGPGAIASGTFVPTPAPAGP